MLRVSDAILFARPIVITNAAYRFMVLEQLAEVDLEADILLEPARRDSGPAIATGAAFALTRDPKAIVLALAADHVVSDAPAFVEACRRSFDTAASGRIVTFGVRPERAATEYGYIRVGAKISGEISSVAEFVEKPDAATAEGYVKDGYLWNSGNFMFGAKMLLDEYRGVDAASVEAVTEAVANAGLDLGFVTLPTESFEKAKAISIDYAVMENTKQAAVIPVSCGWSDVGSWHAVWELSGKDEDGNAAQGATAVFEDSHNCNVSSDKALIALEGVDDLVVVATQDAVLVSRQSDPNGLKRLVAKLRVKAPQVTEDHLKVHRPWGSYQSLDTGDRHQVKRIIVKAGGRLSLQKHHHRSEHWIVVRGAALVTLNDTKTIVHENESIYIPIGATHRMENPGKIPLELIEVQTGSYLGEDDIIRLEDDYKRS